MTAYERVTFERNGKSARVILRDPTERGGFLVGIEVNASGDDVRSAGFTERLHGIDLSAVRSRRAMRWDTKYAELVAETVS